MTPHGPAQRPGARFVIDTLAADPEQLALRHTPNDPRGPVARAVAVTAREVDSLHQTLIGRAAEAIRTLEPVARGEDPDLPLASCVLGATAHDIDLLAARRGAAHQHLTRLVTAYQQLSPTPAAAPASAMPDRRHGEHSEVASRSGTQAMSGDEQLLALQAVECGGLRFKQSALSPTERYLTNGTGVLPPIPAATVEQMIADGLLDVDTGTTPAQGQLLSLTPSGRDALHTADGTAARTPRGAESDADARAAAANTRSPSSTHPAPPPDTPGPGPGTAAPGQRSRTR